MKYGLLMALLLALAAPVNAADLSADFDTALAAFDEGEFDVAARQFRDLTVNFESRYKSLSGPLYCASTDEDERAYQVLIKRDSAGTLVDRNYCAALFGLAYSYTELEQPEIAVAPLRRAVAIAPRSLNYKIELAYALSHSGQEAESLELYQKVLDDGSARGDAYARARALRGLGAAAIDRRDRAAAEQFYRRSQKLEPDSSVAKGQLAYIAENRDD